MVRAITVHEPEWLEDDRDWACAAQEEQEGVCPGCGLPLEETTDPDNEGAYVALEPLRCHGCAPRTAKARTLEDPSDWVLRVAKVR
ncbi:hypothetical protein [Nonomuraea sediminis]|uniref:hypothetical protein n=1 Tax=Nonomuraea sediminis TaxID=2835864 RepID=UPI001BDD5676|nr:hypothetical protein [Nonomuraea sediminis]